MDKKEDKTVPLREITVKIGSNNYKISLPTTGQEVDIEVRKDRYTQGAYKNLLFGDDRGIKSYLAVGSIATFEVLIPDMKKDLQVTSLFELDMYQMKTVLKAYEKYRAWIAEWEEFIQQEDEE